MPAPAGPPHLPVLFSATALALLSPLELPAAEARDEIKQAIRTGLPRYDPAAHEKAQAQRAARAAPRNAPAPLPEAKPEAPTPAPAIVTTMEKILELPAITIRPEAEPPRILPRLTAPTPIHHEPGEELESPSARDARLINNHLSKFDQFLNRFSFLGSSLAARARQAEATKEKARQMDQLAFAIEMQAALGLDPAEVKKLRAEYQKLYYSGPK